MPPAGLCSCPRFMLALFAIGCVNVDASHKRVHLKKKLLCERRPGEADVFLTFEGGPDPADSDLLGVLNKHSAHATFFLVGSSVKRHPDIVRVIDAEGHELAVHGEERVAFAPLDAPSVARYLEDGARSILSVVPSAHLSLMRPLDGSYNPAIDRAGRVLSLRPLLWSCDAQDWKVEPDVGGVSASVVDQINACLAGIFAGMVDGAAGFGAVFRLPSTGAVELVNAILIEASRAGLKAGTCTKLPRASLYEQPEYEPTASVSAE